MSMTFPNETKVSLIQYAPEVTCLCAVTKVPFFARVDIEYTPGKKLLEYIEFEEWLQTLSNKEHTIESLCDVIFDKLTDEVGYTNLSVTLHASTIVHANVQVLRVRNVDAERARAKNNPRIQVPR
jgi:NADPH-dependent 7-cyano-7-deazaguanine reductase QueF